MKTRAAFLVVAALLAASTFTPSLHAQPLVKIETVTVGDAGNAADTTGYGAVSSVFAIGKYEVTISQYASFLNSVAAIAAEEYIASLWNPEMANSLVIAGISRNGGGTVENPYVYSLTGPSGLTPTGASSPGNRPIAYVSWFDAARFANWMNNGATNGASTETGAYTLNGATTGFFNRNIEAQWWIPSEDEWYKAAYYKGGSIDAGYWDYATQSDEAPGNLIGSIPNQANHILPGNIYSVTQSGPFVDPTQNYLTEIGAFTASQSAYDTYDQNGNLHEWNEAIIGSSRGARGGGWDSDEGYMRSSQRFRAMPPSYEDAGIGFRLSTVPEPSTYALLLITGAGALWWARRRR